ncbi:MAG: YbjQ family protein [Hyphomonadaceae bacterium]
MLISTTFEVPNREISETLGIARGNVVRSRFFGRDIVAGLRMVVGGEVHEYTKLLAQSREQALDRMIENAKAMGADAVVGVRFESSAASAQAIEVLAYGTAIKLV